MSEAPAACTVRLGTPGDEQALSLLGAASFLEAFAGVLQARDILEHCGHRHSVQVYHDWLHDPDTRCWIAEAMPGAAPVGYLVLTPPELPRELLAPTDLEIKRIYLLHRFQGLGLGRALMQRARERARQRGAQRLLLGVYVQNHPALGFYRALGYAPVGRRTFQVGATDCEDLILALPLSQESS